jgi:hypothetical protein
MGACTCVFDMRARRCGPVDLRRKASRSFELPERVLQKWAFLLYSTALAVLAIFPTKFTESNCERKITDTDTTSTKCTQGWCSSLQLGPVQRGLPSIWHILCHPTKHDVNPALRQRVPVYMANIMPTQHGGKGYPRSRARCPALGRSSCTTLCPSFCGT